MTFSIVARCPETGQFGAAVSSSSPAVASRCIRARPGVGAAVSQNITDPELGSVALDLMQSGVAPHEALATLQQRPHIAYRQLMAIDGKNAPATYTGERCLGTIGAITGEHAACAGNLLASPDVLRAMLAAFQAASGNLAERLMQAMVAGLAAGGEEGPVHSAGLLVVADLSWPIVDLRMDWVEDDPIDALYHAWRVYEPQIQDYITRARDPRSAPSFGVPGDM
jgi:Uncharacterized conserved protein